MQGAQAAIDKFNGYMLEGRPLAVSLDRKLQEQLQSQMGGGVGGAGGVEAQAQY
jgi:RNA recognition motif-containing protein